MSLQLTPQLFVIFAALVEEECGLDYGTGDRSMFENKLATQAAELGFDSLLDYYYLLRYDDVAGEQRRALVQALVVHETYFFRELAALEQLVDQYLIATVREHGKARVWSAACSTGEEPLTLAMVLDRRGILDRVEIVGTDISAAAIAKATANVHSRRSLRDACPIDLAPLYLEVDGRGVTVQSRIQSAVQFGIANLFDETRLAELGRFDAILCRNVLIYFRDSRIARLVEVVRKMLLPNGVLAVGVSESLMRLGTGVTCEERGGSFFYRSVR